MTQRKQLQTATRHELSRAIRAVLVNAAKQRTVLSAVSLAVSTAASSVNAQELPNPCAAGSCGSAISSFSNGAATAAVSGNTLNVNQTQNNAVLHWQSFNIGEGGVVNFVQPNVTSVALNRIYQNDPSRILGSLNANGRVYLLNQNGFVFGQRSVINVGGLIASSLNMTDAAIENGIAGAINANQPAFDRFATNNGFAGGIDVQQGANISTSDGGQVFMFAPDIVNRGTISTPGGQTLLAAGSPVYLATSSDDNLRGMLVEVGVGGTVTNGDSAANSGVADPSKLVGQIIAERGNVTLAGLAVNQLGRISATTTVRENGSIRLQARDGGSIELATHALSRVNANGGDLELGANSRTEVTLAASGETAVDSTAQLRSQIALQGRRIAIREDARIEARGGAIDVAARAASPDAPLNGTSNDGSRIYVGEGATLDVSGANIELAMERNVISAELRGDELANSPMQRNGALRGQAVQVDIRASGTRDDGSEWQGTPIGNVAGQIGLIERDVFERNLNGGAISLNSQGDAILAAGSTIDLSGGSIRYRDGFINTSVLLSADGRAYNIADADPSRAYTGITGNALTVTHSRWGVTETFVGIGGRGNFERGYIEGKDAGVLSMITPVAIIDGAIRADVQAGRYQRRLATALPTLKPVDVFYRSYDELPLGGTFNFGFMPTSGADNDRVASNVEFGGGLVLPTLSGTFNPLQDALPSSLTATRLRSDLFGEDRVVRTQISVNGSVDSPESVSLLLPGQSQFRVTAGNISWAGDIIAPSGSIGMTALLTQTTPIGEIGIDIAGTALLDVGGRWINDSLSLNPRGSFTPLFINGGSVSLRAEAGSLSLHEGSVIDVSGGAWARGNGGVTFGRAGSIDLAANGNLAALGESVVLNQGADLRGFGFERGGTLTLAAPEICIASDGNCGTNVASTLRLTPEDLLAGGFADINLRSNERGLLVESGTTINLQQRNRWLSDGALNVASGANVGSLSTVTVLPEYLRSAANLSLQASVNNLLTDSAVHNSTTFLNVPGLTIEAGASINGDDGAMLSLTSNTRAIVDGALTAHAGTINITLDNTLPISEIPNSQAIWLGSTARLDVSGVTALQPNAMGLRQGEVLDGGAVNIKAQRGAVIANQGSMIDVSGSSATLDIQNIGGIGATSTPTVIASNGGTINVSASDAILLSGQMDAHAGISSGSASGGTLRIKLDAASRSGNQSGMLLPVESRRIVLSQASTPVSIAAGTTLPSTFANQARISSEQIADAGFATAVLTAETTSGVTTPNGPNEIASGRIEFDDNFNLNLSRALVLDAARITGNGNVGISAAYVSMGHSTPVYQETSAASAIGTGSFSANGAFVELVGSSSIDGFDAVNLFSSGDLRFRGVQQQAASTITGGLRTNADLTLRADQVYATTLSNIDVAVENNPTGVLRVESTGGARDTVLSAASHLSLTANTIEQAGVLRAPFGAIELNAETVRLESGSLTSTSAEGAVIPFGAIQAGNDWVYSLQGQTLILGSTLDAPEQNVVLNGTQVDVNAGATIDVSGGGDLLAYEFQPGTTGKEDVLSALERPGRFAIVPRLRLSQAPHDPQESAGSTLNIGDSIHISAGVDGLPAGDYVLLPARYALLEGGYIVETAERYTDLQTGVALRQLNGSSIVSGYRRNALTSFADTRRSGFVVTPGVVLAQEARYDTARASSFFAERAQRTGTAPPRLPQDAGLLSIAAVSQLNLDGALRAQATAGGRGAAVDISAQNLLVSNTASGNAGQVVVNASDLTALGAESILLGGRRSSTDDGVAIDAAAENVTIDGGASLAVPELILVANDTVRVGAGASLTASGAVATTDNYVTNGDGAMLRLAAGEQAAITRNNETGARGILILDQGATLTANGGALALDASLDTQSDATLALNAGSLSLGASRINLGTASPFASGLTLDAEQLNALNLNELVLASRSSIDLYGSVNLNVNDLALDGAGLRSWSSDSDASIAATRSITLSNRDERTDTHAATGAGALRLNAADIVVGEGEHTISGYELVVLSASNQLLLSSQSREIAPDANPVAGGLAVIGDLEIATPVVLATRGSETSIDATGALTLTGNAATPQQAELGGNIELSGSAVSIATRIEAAAGGIEITASGGDVTLANGTVLDAAGRTRDFDGVIVAAPAGEVSLIAQQGNVVAQSGSVIDVSAAGDGEAGQLNITAVAGTVVVAGELRGSAGSDHNSGGVNVDATALGNVSALNAVLNAGGFNAERKLRQHGAGDITIGVNDTVRAERVGLTADRGSVVINGTIDASGSKAGDVVLSAQDDVIVNGSIVATASAANGDGGELDLRADAGTVQINSGARIDLSSGPQSNEGGELRLRVSRAVLTDADISNDVVLAGTIEGVERTSLEAFARYDAADIGAQDGVITAAQTAANDDNTLYLHAREFMDNSGAAIIAALNRTGDSAFHLLPGIEIYSPGDLSIGDANPSPFQGWDLSAWRFGTTSVPGVLTLRAGSDLNINRSLSDGFTGLTGTNATAAAFRLTSTTDSWSYRLIAGADRDSADLLATNRSGGGDFSIANGIATSSNTNPGTYRMVRTGNGSIDVAAAGNFTLGNQQSMLYTAGLASTQGVSLGSSATGLGDRRYPVDGGDISIDVGGDINGGRSQQFVTDWLWRTGRSADENPVGLATGWTVNFVRFQQDVAALGGGDVDIRAGGSVRGLSVSVPSIGVQMGGAQARDSRVDVVGGGNLIVTADRAIEGGSYFVGLGSGQLITAGDIRNLPTLDNEGLYPLLGLGDGVWKVTARESLGIEAVVNPTMLPQGRSQPGISSETNQSWFSTYSASSGISTLSVSGDTYLANRTATIRETLTSLGVGESEQFVLQLAPPSLSAVSMSGDLLLGGEISLFPGAGAALNLFAERNVVRSGDASFVLQQLDADPSFLPNVLSPRTNSDRIREVISGVDVASKPSLNAHSTIPVHASDASLTRVVARTGDINFEQFSATGLTDISRISVATPVRMFAGNDIIDLPLFMQHDDAGDVSSIVSAGGVIYTVARADSGAILNNEGREIAVDGPGSLLIAAGKDVDLQTSAGISSRGNLFNANLPEVGANIEIVAGLQGQAPRYADFSQRYVVGSGQYDIELRAYIAEVTGAEPASRGEALESFSLLEPQQQAVLLRRLLISELRAAAVNAASPDPSKKDDYSRGFAALETMFPGSTGEGNPYRGDIALYFSRIYTLDGGDITLLTPGGGVNVGLAAPPTSFGIRKDADRLGIVTQRGGNIGIAMDRDLQVNESRMFAINNSDIIVWSSSGDIDAGRGAKTAISAPDAVVTYDRDGRPTTTYSATLAGSGIQTRTATEEFESGDVVLAAPRGVVNAGDAGIVAGNLTIAATAVLGADNIKVSGVAVGVPVDTGGLGASLAGVSAAANSASNSAAMALDGSESKENLSPAAEAALSWLEVFVVGLGEDGCKQDDVECLKRQN
jgi:filamentous hemagglutinin